MKTVDPTTQNYFDDIDLGDEFEDEWTPTMDQVLGYLGLEGDALGAGGGPTGDGRFTDPEGAKKLGFPKPIVPGAFSLSKLTKLVTDWAGTEGTVDFVDVNFRRPVLHDDALKVLGLVTDTEEGDGGGTVKLDIYLENERGERPLQGTAVVQLPGR
ncbi:MAG: MaoC/PaaZ C-terminal domain-containing protein [Chloroflexi bacterium]|nr:MaoC/PaaZ C-terminal domain-containing protein [Chloroflexota bacterium]